MSSEKTITPRLRYFDCRSRGQALRFALAASGVEFEDIRVPITELSAFRATAHRAEVGGPFAALPVLEWNGQVVAQTLAIGNVLDRELFGASERSFERKAWLDMVTCAAHLDMQAPYSFVLWLPEDCPDRELGQRAGTLFAALAQKLMQLETLLEQSRVPGQFFGGERPVIADFFVYESVDRACLVFGEAFRERLNATQKIARLKAATESGGHIDSALVNVPDQITGSPSEMILRQRLLDNPSLWHPSDSGVAD